MEQLSLDEIVNAVNAKTVSSWQLAVGKEIGKSQIQIQIPNSNPQIFFSSISTDSRTTKRGDLFLALKGSNHDGHNFVNHAIGNGAKGAVVDYGFRIADLRIFLPTANCQLPSILNPQSIIRVPDTTKTLGDLARYYRKKMSAKIVAITGSNGKTTTKDMVYHLLSKRFKAVKSKASFNNYIGVPLTIFDLDANHKFGIVEMGTNAFGEIRRLSEIASPDIAVITNIAETHLEGLKNICGVKKAKAEIVENIKEDGLLLVNADDKLAMEIGKDFHGEFIGFGLDKDAKVRASRIKRSIQGWSFVINDTCRVTLPIPGYHNVFNCLAAIAIVFSLGIEMEDIDDGFNDFRLPPMRMDKETIIIADERYYDQDNGNLLSAAENMQVTVINDAYNANPSSMRAAIHEFSVIQCNGRKIFVCGDMLELGAESERLHFEAGKEIGISDIDILWAAGKMSAYVIDGAMEAGMPEENIMGFESLEDLLHLALPTLKADDTILIKGSRAMKLERVADRIKSYSQMNLHLSEGKVN